ncbi:MAG: Fe-S cluster assembly protein SufD [Bacteroidales bacterium]|nr:Fe-S cluster assembly protein SufD [Bacteroidales bacterium]
MQDNSDIKLNPGFFNSLYKENRKLLFSHGNGILNKHREDAIQRFCSQGIPTRKNENYKYTNLIPSFNIDYKFLFNSEKEQFNVEDIFKCDVPELETEIIILVNGFYYHRDNLLQKLPNGIIIGSLSKAAEEMPDLVAKHYHKYAGDEKDSLISLNTAFSLDGIFVYIPENVIVKKPIQIINLSISGSNLLIQHRNLIVLNNNAEAHIIICDRSLSHRRFLTNQVLEVSVGENASLDLIRLQNEHLGATQISHTYVQQQQNSKTLFNTITLHGGMVRNNIQVSLNGEGCENSTLGLYLLDQDQHIGNFTAIEHNYPNCLSNQLFKGVLDHNSIGAFNGKIYVAKDAQKTLAYQSNNSILLSSDAKMNSKPQLEIYADDVKCSHGATVGQLNEDALFYIRARGIDEKEARLMLMNGFVNDVIKQINSEPLRERITDLVTKRLRGELSRCNQCKLNCGE